MRCLARLRSYLSGTRVVGVGRRHTVLWGGAQVVRTTIYFEGCDGVVELGRGTRLQDCELVLRGDRARVWIDNHVRLTRVKIVVEDEGSVVRIGRGTTMTGATVQSKEGRCVEIGPECMIGHGLEIVNSDSHSLIDVRTNTRTNAAKDVMIGRHVWLAADVKVGKGVCIGDNAVVAAGSRVLRDVPGGALAAGSPARVCRVGVDWRRER